MAQENKSKVSILTNGIIKENPVLRLVLGTCSILAVTTAVSSALGMGMDGTKNIVMNQDFDAYSGATISSTALFAAINDCINCFNELA